MEKVMVFGTFDSLHKGHIFFLNEARKRGNFLIAITARDQTVDELKGHSPLNDFYKREKKLKKSGLVDRVLPSDTVRGSWNVITRERPDVICLGHDQTAMKKNLEAWLETQDDYEPQLVVFPPYKRKWFSTTAYRRRRETGFLLLLFLAMLLMAFSWISGKAVSSEAPFSVLIFWRFFLSFLPFTLFLKSREALKIPRKGWIFIVLSSLSLISYNILFFTGLRAGLAGKGGVMVTTLNPLITTGIILLINRKLPSRVVLASLVLGAVGGVFFMEPWIFQSEQILDRTNLLFLGAALCWALLTVFTSQALKSMKLGVYNFFLYLISAAIALVIAIPDRPFDFQKLTLPFWINIIYLSFFVTSLATSLYFRAAHKLGPSRASTFTFAIPLMALLLSWLFLKEIPHWPTLVGGSLSLTGLYLINTTKEKI